MILSSHNSWSYLKPSKWWMYPIAFTAKCQSANIQEQYKKYNVRCFDLRIAFNKKGIPYIAHGLIQYRYNMEGIINDLNFINGQKDCYVRVIHETRTKGKYTPKAIKEFRDFCSWLTNKFLNIRFWGGRNLYNWNTDFDFGLYPTCKEKYSSVCKPHIIDGWYPWLYARLNNRKILAEGTDRDILMIDFVNI